MKTTTLNSLCASIATLLALTFSNGAAAHPDGHDMPQVRPNPVKLDVSANASGVSVMATRDGVAYPTSGASGTLTVRDGKHRKVVALRPAGTNTMATKTALKIAAGSTATVSVTFGDKTSASAEMVVK